jgi:hypothetical protein
MAKLFEPIIFFSYTGRFDMDKHKKWIDDNPNKRPKPLETRKHVSHFYSGGDICDITGNYIYTIGLKTFAIAI